MAKEFALDIECTGGGFYVPEEFMLELIMRAHYKRVMPSQHGRRAAWETGFRVGYMFGMMSICPYKAAGPRRDWAAGKAAGRKHKLDENVLTFGTRFGSRFPGERHTSVTSHATSMGNISLEMLQDAYAEDSRRNQKNTIAALFGVPPKYIGLDLASGFDYSVVERRIIANTPTMPAPLFNKKCTYKGLLPE